MSLNIGIFGHVDSGKTSLAKALSTVASTAAFDAHAKSANLRANTIDLGLSALKLGDQSLALIDCPGHASLVRAVLAASSVIDLAIIVVSAVGGIESQTAEHLLLVSLICPKHVIVVINKIDLVAESQVLNVQKTIKKALNYLKIDVDSPIIPISLINAQEDDVKKVLSALNEKVFVPERVSSGKFIMSVDHCFPLQGKGTVMTGTVVDGECKIGMEVEIPLMNEKRKIKNIQKWKENAMNAQMGERAALLFSNLSSKDIDRTVIFEPGALQNSKFILASIKSISDFKRSLSDGIKLHISIGFETTIAVCLFLNEQSSNDFEIVKEFDESVNFVLMQFERRVYCRVGQFYIASKLDVVGPGCRFAFHGNIQKFLNGINDVRRFRMKHKSGRIDRIENERSLICTSLFKKETNINVFISFKVRLSTGEVGTIDSSFGKSGKVRISVLDGLSEKTIESFKSGEIITVDLYAKKYPNEIISFIPNL